MAMRTSFKPGALIHELALLFGPVMEGCHIIDSHMKREREREREEWSVLRAVRRLQCETVPISFFEIPFQPRFLLEELIFLSSKMDRTVGVIKLKGSPCERWLAVRMRYCHSGSFQVFRSGLQGMWWEQRSRARAWALLHRAGQRFQETAWNRQLVQST